MTTGLADLLQTLATRDGVEAVVLVSPDGLPIQQSGGTGADGEALAALAATAQRHAARLADGAGHGMLRTVLLESDEGVLILSDAGTGNLLLLRVGADAEFGDLLLELRRGRPTLGELL